MKTGTFNHEEVDEVRFALGRWIDSADAGEMTGDEMVAVLGNIRDQLDETIGHLRSALGW